MQLAKKTAGPNRYQAILQKIFLDRYVVGQTEVPFRREDLLTAATELNLDAPKNLGDVIYSMRYRKGGAEAITATQPEGLEWIIEGAGSAQYIFKLVKINRIVPNRELVTTKIPDSTPEIVIAYALTDEQALLAKVRYNRLIDLFLGIVTYSLQNHLRTTVAKIGQIEIDEIYVGIDRQGRQYVIPVQAKGGSDQLSVVQTKQDLSYCAERYPNLVCRAISAQFMEDNLIALFELTVEEDEVKVVEERHYRLVDSGEITPADLEAYSYRV